MASPANSIPDTSLGLTADEIQVLRRAQIEAANAAAGSSSSRAASRASSQGLLLLNTSSLTSLSRYFDRLMQQISGRLDYLSEQSQVVAQQQYDRAGNAIEIADAEIERLNNILRQIDELEDDFDRMARLKDIVKTFRARVEEVERRVEESTASRRDGGGHRHRHRHGETTGSRSHRR
ncbi:hypothetical protein VE02_06035 [Pseudogymnoascus sp. 03VT05]|nr:hypothetical protein VE02_06035 [Pseudogymnoascus sp. 03VT05]